MPSKKKGRRRRVIGEREESTSTTTGQVAPPPIPSNETNDEATSSQPQSLIESQNLLIADGQFNQIRGHYTNIVLNVNPTSDNTLTIQGSPSLAGPVTSNETDHSRPPPSRESTQPNHRRTSPRPEVNRTMPTQKSNDIYERHLILKGRGFPLWIPGPNRALHIDYRRTGVRIGDVGIITPSGGFSFLFNICLPHDHPVNPPDLPEHFAPISPKIAATDIESFEVFTSGSHLASASIKRSSLSTAISTGSVFESSASEGAILIMPRGARSEDLGNYARFRKYAAANVADWYMFVNGPRGREAKNGDVHLVVGSDKTTSWGIATFVNQTQQNSCRLKFCPSEGESASTYTWSENSGATDVRAGPDSDVSDALRIETDPPDFQFENQCLFVRTLNITLTDDVWADIHSTLGSVHVDPRHVRDHSAYHHPQLSTPTSGGSNLSPSPGVQYGTRRATSSNYGLENVDLTSDNNPGMFISGPPGRLTAHPSKFLNDMLLAKVPTAKMAITHDDDWSSVITQYDSALADLYYNLSFSDVAANILASRKICEENGVIFLQPNEIPNDEIPSYDSEMAITYDDGWSSVITQADRTLAADSYYNFSDVTVNSPASQRISEEKGQFVDYNNLSVQGSQREGPHQQLLYQQGQSNYTGLQYSQTQTPNPPHFSSSLHGAFTMPTNQQLPSQGSSDRDDSANRPKLRRVCARCRKFKFKCEYQTETEPCKRCLNGGHECFIPARKIGRTRPKRKHLLSQIQSQAQKIESLMQQLAEVTAASPANKPKLPQLNTMITDPENTLVPSPTAPGPYFSSISGSASGTGQDGKKMEMEIDDAANTAISDWIAQARQSLDHFGALVGIGGGDDDEIVNVFEELDGFGDTDDRYEVAIEELNNDDMKSEGLDGHRSLRPKSSVSSFGTSGTGKPASLPVKVSPFGLLANAKRIKTGHKRKRRAVSVERDNEDKGPGIANENFFKTMPALNAFGRRLERAQHQAPHILARGMISPQEAEKLFEIYFDSMNLSVSLLDPVLYTAQRTFYRSPFLFTVICAIASRYFTERPIYATLMEYAQLAAGTALISGNKNIEMCQAYLLLSLYPLPARKWEDQRTWLYLGLAVRTATDINLHLPMTVKPLNENHTREVLNRTRVWLNCLNVERSAALQYGKPTTINPSDYNLNDSEDWWKSSPHNMKKFDIHICAYNGELKIMAEFLTKIYSDPKHLTGLNKDVDFEKIATEADDQLKAHEKKWFAILEQTDMSDPQYSFRTTLLHLAHSYARLVALSYGFQHAFVLNEGTDENPFLTRCLEAASDVVHAVVVNGPTHRPFFRHGPEEQSVFVTFASAFLVKLLQPKFSSYLTQEQRVNIQDMVRSVIDLLSEIAIDYQHGPKLYSRFLEKLLARLDLTSPGSSSNVSPPPRVKPHRPYRPFYSKGQAPSSRTPFNYNDFMSDCPSLTRSSSLSPPPTEAALSFDQFAPVGGIDPFVPNMVTSTDASNAPLMGDMFQASLPFDEDIVKSMQSMTDPNIWQDISLPGFDWMAQFQQNLGIDMNSSLSPPPTEAALSFDQSALVGGIDPFAPNMVTSTDASNAPLMGNMFQASLPFDEDIVKSMQSIQTQTYGKT